MFKRYKVYRQDTHNLVHYLQDREIGINRQNFRGKRHHSFDTRVYLSITPNLSVQSIEKPNGFIRKFTPDGRYLLSFSYCQTALDVYEYRGVGSVATLLQNQINESLEGKDTSPEARNIRQTIFERMFKLRWSIPITENPYPPFSRTHLNREFSLFLDDGRYVLTAYMTRSPDPFISAAFMMNYFDLFEECDLFNYTLCLVDLQRGVLSHQYTFINDFIFLSHNHGISVYGSLIAVMSRCRQCIDLLQVISGKLVRTHQVGPHGFIRPDELSGLPEEFSTPAATTFSHLKQRILVWIYNEINKLNPKDVAKKLKKFYRQFKEYEDMTMQKMQLIDQETLLIRYELDEKADNNSGARLSASNDYQSEFRIYVFYSLSEEKVLKVYEDHSIELLYILRNYCDTFRNARSLQTRLPSSSPSNNIFFRSAFNAAVIAIHGGQSEAALRFNPTLPISSQSFATSPYLDYNVFNYDDRLISSLERPKVSLMGPVRFKDREAHILKFRLLLEPGSHAHNPSSIGPEAESNNRELIAFVFHPYEPFIISIQKLVSRYAINFHLYNPATEVTPHS